MGWEASRYVRACKMIRVLPFGHGFFYCACEGRVLTWLPKGQRILQGGELAGVSVTYFSPNSWDSWRMDYLCFQLSFRVQISRPTLCSYCFLLYMLGSLKSSVHLFRKGCNTSCSRKGPSNDCAVQVSSTCVSVCVCVLPDQWSGIAFAKEEQMFCRSQDFLDHR